MNSVYSSTIIILFFGILLSLFSCTEFEKSENPEETVLNKLPGVYLDLNYHYYHNGNAFVPNGIFLVEDQRKIATYLGQKKVWGDTLAINNDTFVACKFQLKLEPRYGEPIWVDGDELTPIDAEDALPYLGIEEETVLGNGNYCFIRSLDGLNRGQHSAQRIGIVRFTISNGKVNGFRYNADEFFNKGTFSGTINGSKMNLTVNDPYMDNSGFEQSNQIWYMNEETLLAGDWGGNRFVIYEAHECDEHLNVTYPSTNLDVRVYPTFEDIHVTIVPVNENETNSGSDRLNDSGSTGKSAQELGQWLCSETFVENTLDSSIEFEPLDAGLYSEGVMIMNQIGCNFVYNYKISNQLIHCTFFQSDCGRSSEDVELIIDYNQRKIEINIRGDILPFYAE